MKFALPSTISFLYAILAFSFLAAAMPGGAPPPVTSTVTVTAPGASSTPASSCSTGPIQCCDSVQSAGSGGIVSVLLGLLGLVLDPSILVGLTCSPISVIGVGGGNCNANAVCCENNNVGGLISIGCVPVIL